MSSKRHKNKRPSGAHRNHRTEAPAATQQPAESIDKLVEATPANPIDLAPSANGFDTLQSAEASTEPASIATDPTSIAAIGEQLRAAREAQGLSLEDAGHQLRLPARVLRKLESDDLSGIDYPIYLRGYLRSYSKLLGVTLPSLQTTMAHAEVAAPTLTPTGGMSHGRYLLQRYAAGATYVVVTALIVVPLLVLGLNGGIHRETARVAPLDGANNSPTRVSTPAAGSHEEPLMASMAPFAALQKDLDHHAVEPAATPAAVVSANAPTPPAAAHDEHSVDIQLQAPSWVEITDASGMRLEYGLLSAGNYRYHSNKVLDIRLGNSADAAVDVDGTALDLQPYRRANVAHFRLDPKTGRPPEAKNG